MKFKHNTRRHAVEYEKAISEWWKTNKIFEKSVEQRSADEAYVFYDGPPFITGNPHHGTLLSSVIKDIVPRYFTMRGRRVERVWGWDCHGLPAENFTEKHLNGTVSRKAGGKPDELILKSGDETKNISLEEYVKTARDLMVANSELWESYIDRIGRWVDFKGAYRTMDKSFMESVWWAFKSLYDKGLIYEGEKVLMYDTKFATPVSKAEVTMDNDAYQTVTDPSVFVKFELTRESVGSTTRELNLPVYLLAWTTTPWTLPANMALAVNPKLTYSEIRVGDEIYILAKDLVGKVLIDDQKKPLEYEIIHEEISGAKLVGKQYVPLFPEVNGSVVSENIIQKADDVRSLSDLHNLTRAIVERAVELKNKHTDDRDSTVNYACIFSQSNAEYERLVELVGRFGKEIENHGSGPLFQIEPFATVAGDLRLVRIRKYDAEHTDLGDADFTLQNYDDFKKKYVGEDGFATMKRPGVGGKTFEMIELMEKDFPVRVYFSDPPMDEQLGLEKTKSSQNFHKVYAADFVGENDGTGIVHIAPAYGEDDFTLAKENDIPVLHAIDDNGYYLPKFAEQLNKIGVQNTDETGIEVWAANKFIAKCLLETGVVWKIDYIRHEYPFNPRSRQRIMYRAIPSWFFDIQGQKPLMLAKNENINWFPEHLKHGRFAKNIEQAPDWTLSRNRFWATAMPVWKGDKGTVKVVGSYAELAELSGQTLDDYHRPWVDKVEFDLTLDGKPVRHSELVSEPRNNVKVTYFVHGTTTDNENHKSTGWNGGELSELGIKQSKELRALIKNKRFDAIFCSDLNRAVESAKLNFPDAKIIQDKRLRECTYGDLNGADSDKVVDVDHIEKPFPNGESMKDVEKRVRDFCDFVAENYAGKKVAIVSHKAPQFAFQVITENRDWAEVIENDWRKEKKWQAGWEYEVKTGTSQNAETEHFTRIEEVLDGWFESGSMPFAQFHYPFENKAKFEANYPADFITEYVGQVRAWFYYVHAVNTSLAEIGAFGEMKDAEEENE